MWNLPGPEIEPVSPALAGALNHWTTRKVQNLPLNKLPMVCEFALQIQEHALKCNWSLMVLGLNLPFASCRDMDKSIQAFATFPIN